MILTQKRERCPYCSGDGWVWGDEVYVCSMCDSEYNHCTEATSCEAKHEERQDKYWDKHLLKMGAEALEKASKVPGQRKLL